MATIQFKSGNWEQFQKEEGKKVVIYTKAPWSLVYNGERKDYELQTVVAGFESTEGIFLGVSRTSPMEKIHWKMKGREIASGRALKLKKEFEMQRADLHKEVLKSEDGKTITVIAERKEDLALIQPPHFYWFGKGEAGKEVTKEKVEKKAQH